MANFKRIIGTIEGSSFVAFEIENGNNENNIGDVVWFSQDGTRLEVSDYIEEDELKELLECFPRNERQGIKGALMRMNII